ncbi:MAG: four helix bundle protein [Ignavibacteria bacterium]|nr:four helix bundle protein [Ignavibacteria bacterium]
MTKIQRFEDLEVYKNALDISVYVYELTSQGKLSKDYGLKDQLTRAAVSISNNIAEGFEYDNKKDFIKFLRYSKGSTGEVRNMLNLLVRIEFIEEDRYSFLYEKVSSLSKQLFGFTQYLKNYNN